MIVESKLLRNHYVNAVLNLIPDIAIAWAVVKYTDSGLVGFLWTFFGLQVLYFLIWLKTFAWTWIRWWLSGRQKLIAHLENFLMDNKFPRPPDTCEGVDGYLNGVVDNANVDQKVRAKAACKIGTLQGIAAAGRFTIGFQLRMAFEEAIERYSRQFKGPHEKQPVTKTEPIAVKMKKEELETVLWLADAGLQLWIYRPDHPLRTSPQLAHDTAAAYGKVLDTFERRMVPDLLLESEEDKERQFVNHENRFKDLWTWYPERLSNRLILAGE